MDLGLGDRVALVTGSYRGTGAAIARALAAEGAAVLVHGFAVAEADPVVAEIIAAGGRAEAVFGDITGDDGAAEVAAQALRLAGRVDVLVNNYGTADRGRWDDTGGDDWLQAYQKNVLTAVRMIQLLVEPMRARGWGRIIQLGTIGSTRPNARMPHYYASKGALATLTVSLAKELAGSAITVNTVSPGLTRTVEGLATMVLAFIGFATVGTVVFTTRTGLAIHRNAIEVLHFIGAQDSYIASQFASRALSLGLKGGVIGLLLAAPTLWGIAVMAAEMEAGLLPDITLGPPHYSAVVALPLVIAFIAMVTARLTVMKTLSRML